jgi:hypothetical protein
MKYFSKPAIKLCKFQKNINLDGNLTPLILALEGWGLLKISSYEHPNWIGIKKIILKDNQSLTFLVPKNSIINIEFYNTLGNTKNYYKSPGPNYAFKKPPKPLTVKLKKLQIDGLKNPSFKINYSKQIVSSLIKVGINIKGYRLKQNGLKFRLKNNIKKEIINIPKFGINKDMINQKLKNNSIKI